MTKPQTTQVSRKSKTQVKLEAKLKQQTATLNNPKVQRSVFLDSLRQLGVCIFIVLITLQVTYLKARNIARDLGIAEESFLSETLQNPSIIAIMLRDTEILCNLFFFLISLILSILLSRSTIRYFKDINK